MTTSMSFRRHSHSRPPQYRTPSPPRHAVEPLSPHASADYHRFPVNNSSADSARAPQNRSEQMMHTVDGYREIDAHSDPSPAETKFMGKIGHTRSGSNIDTLATIALATRARFGSLAYDAHHHDTPTPSYAPLDGDSSERPSKRARSERSPSPAWQKAAVRPATSHISSLDSMKTDAELLLNFARPSNFPPRPVQPVQQSPSDVAQINMESRWSIPAQIPLDTVTDGPALFGGSGSTQVRVRSRSDGAAALSRPIINGYNSSSPKQPPLMGPVWEDDSSGFEQHNERKPGVIDEKAEPQQSKRAPKSKTHRRSSDAVTKSEVVEPETESSNQASCGACNLVRVPINSGEDTEVTWVNCDGCNKWFHIVCAGFKNDREIRTVDKFICKECRPIHGPTTFVRKSSRPKTSIDYAGLNQGFVKSSTEAPNHHYIQPIKEGKMTFLPDNFARLPAELVTAEHFERGIGMTEPIVIPAALNPRTHPAALGSQNHDACGKEASSQEEFDAMIDGNDYDGYEEVMDCCQDLLGMVIPSNLTVRAVGELYGLEERVEVIDVKSQQGEDKRWNMQKWVDYYYDTSSLKTVRNVISLEVSQSPIGKLIRRPKIVRDLDLQDAVWPKELQETGDYPKVQFYCLMSVADCYTDFHIDFGGSSVYYHILKGKKTFLFIPPKERHLKKYEEWCNSAAQDTTFLGDQTKECYRVDLSEGDTMLIPSGWIHAVWTPEDSLVIGGNFLTRMNYGMQIRIAQIEKDTKVPRKFRYPFFQKIMWYAAFKYLEEDPVPQGVLDSFAEDENYRFHREYPVYYDFGEHANKADSGTAYYNSRFYSQAELDGLPELAKYLLRTALIAGGYMVDGVTKETRNAISRSIPKGQGDPIETIVRFGIWIAWKRGNEPAAQWTRPGAISLETKVDISDKKRPARPTRRSERNVNNGNNGNSRASTGSDVAKPVQNLEEGVPATTSLSTSTSNKGSPTPTKRKVSFPDIKLEDDLMAKSIAKGTTLGPKRVACDACRKRRIRCRHKADQNGELVANKLGVPSDTNGAPFRIRTESDVHSGSAIIASAEESMASDHTALRLGVSGSGSVSQDGIYNGPTASHGNSPGSLNSAKKGRNKACEECRKSKRRCIHDESGNVDPVKAQERAKPRTGSIKRPRSSDEYSYLSKRQKPNETSQELKLGENLPELNRGAAQFIHDDITMDVNARLESRAADKLKDIGSSEYMKPPSVASISPTHRNAEEKGPSDSPARDEDAAETSKVAPTAGDSLVSPPTSHLDDMDGIANQGHATQVLSVNGGHIQERQIEVNTPASTSPKLPHPTIPEVTTASGESAELNEIHAPDTVEHKPISSHAGPSPKPTKPSSRPSSSHKSKQSMTTKESKHTHPVVESKGSSVRGRHDASPTSPQRPSKQVKRDRVSFSEVDADAESLKLIKEIQEQEFGLRRRTARS